MIKITDKMVIALLKKGLTYEVDDYDMEIEVPMSAFSGDEEDTEVMNMKAKMKGFRLQITQD